MQLHSNIQNVCDNEINASATNLIIQKYVTLFLIVLISSPYVKGMRRIQFLNYEHVASRCDKAAN